ncbi:hypothetical protein B0J18DRAFT_468704 [Chaetomium sp. MPI-SDFR-AT-0129]|nr:hypothetical protein B0J18DRAFT_468704 [Chaetomium sp. MPI-SDFR-AT-0129]
MGRKADENLPEVVQNQPAPRTGEYAPEVVPDSSPEAAQQRYFQESDKYPALYDNSPKFPHEPPPPGGYSPDQQYQQPHNQAWSPDAAYPVSAVSPNSSVPWQSFPDGGEDQQTYVGSEPPEPEKRICGLRKRTFIIVAAILGVVIVAVAIGGGVGGAMSARNSSAAAAETSSAASSTASPSSTSSSASASASSTTSEEPTPTPTSLVNTDPSVFDQRIAFQGWNKENITGNATQIYPHLGVYDLEFPIHSYIWVSNQTDCCVNFCDLDAKQHGFACSSKWQNHSSFAFPRIVLWCGNRNHVPDQQRCK